MAVLKSFLSCFKCHKNICLEYRHPVVVGVTQSKQSPNRSALAVFQEMCVEEVNKNLPRNPICFGFSLTD